ncbi:MAG: hypothetical protein JW995_02995 [Melioribacteraceae bacterium]|nr:hypothetical protein [Melioribacteraceae bacterium]
MSRPGKVIISTGLIILGLLNILSETGVLNFELNTLIIHLFLFYGLIIVMTTIGRNSRGLLFIGAQIFIAGIAMLMTEKFEILNSVKILFPSVLFSFGAGFVMLYIDNPKEKTFLIIASLLMLISIFAMLFLSNSGIILSAGRVINILLAFWPVILSMMGITLLVNKNEASSH